MYKKEYTRTVSCIGISNNERMGINNVSMAQRTLSEMAIAFLAAALSIAVHTLPFLIYGAHPLGYDTGFYRRYLIQPFSGLPNSAVPGLGDDALIPRLIFDALRFLHLPTDAILYGSYLFCFALIPVLGFFLLRTYLGKRGAFIGACLLAFSPVLYAAFWFMLWKNAFALVLLLGAFIALERRALWWVILLEIGIALSHKTTAIIYLATLAVLFLIQKENRKDICTHLLITGLAFLTVNISLPGEIARVTPSAVFLGWSEFVTLSVAFMPAAILGLFFWKTSPLPKTLVAFACVSILFPLLRLPFYERVFVFTDVALALLSAFGIKFLITKIQQEGWRLRASLYALALFAFAGFFLGNLENQIKTLQPLVSGSGIRQIENIGTQVPENALLLTTTDEAPWFEGFTQNHIAAPGMLQDRHNLEAWTAFWNSTSTPARIEFLNSFPQPLYISTFGDFTDLIGTSIPCLKEIAPSLLKNECVTAD